jgi:hypothetical protein
MCAPGALKALGAPVEAERQAPSHKIYLWVSPKNADLIGFDAKLSAPSGPNWKD